jgi:formate hydrogenlyase transcriptional activator
LEPHDLPGDFQQYRTLLEVSESICSHRDLKALLQELSKRLRSLAQFEFIGLHLHNPSRNVMQTLYLGTGEGETVRDLALPMEDSASARVFLSQQPMVVRSLDDVADLPKVKTVLEKLGSESFCMFPLTTAMRRLGAVGFGRKGRSTFGETELEFLRQVTKLVSMAVDNALNFESALAAQQQLAHERDRQRLLLEINNTLTTHLDLRELMKAISTCLRRVMPYDLAGFCLYDPNTGQLSAHALDFPQNQDVVGVGDPVPLEGTPEGKAFTSRKAVLIKRLSLEEFPEEIVKRAAAHGLDSGIAVPLISRGRVLGTLSVISLRENAFTEDDAELLTGIGSQVAIAIENGLAYREIAELKDKLSKEKLYLEDEIRTQYNFEEIIGDSPALKRVLKQVETVAPTDSTVLIQGETGAGKELIARAIHNLSRRRERTFVKMNCAAIPTGLLESELFGHERGAFTGAIAQKIGRFELAHQGTLFLDEVGDIPLELQSKLLRVLQEQEFERLGSTRTIKVNIRLVAATNRDLEQMASDKEFRSDLYYRLNVFPITVPSLRERAQDIPVLVRYFTQKYARRMDKKIQSIPADVLAALAKYHWPGNIRELENLIERSVILSQGPDLQVPLGELKVRAVAPAPAPTSADGDGTLEAAERAHILRALKETDWVLGGASGAAARLGMKRTTLQSKIKKLGISRPV